MSVTIEPPNQHQAEKLATAPIIQLNKTLIINGNNQLSAYATTGDGSKANPYLLANYNSSSGIELVNIDKYFILNNTNIEINSANYNPKNTAMFNVGIQLFNVSHGTISHTIIGYPGYDGSVGIRLNSSINNVIYDNFINTGSDVGFGIVLFNSNFNMIQKNRVSGFSSCVLLINSNNNKFKNNIARMASVDGYVIDSSKNNIFQNNTSSFNKAKGFEISKDINTTFNTNTVANNSEDGFDIYRSNETVFTNNTVIQNGGTGFVLNYSNETIFTNNTANKNSGDGFDVYYSNETILANNIANNNSGLGLRVFKNKKLTLKNNQFGKTNLPKNVLMENLLLILTFVVISAFIIAVVLHKRRRKSLISNTYFCPKCQKRININSTFCENCGLQIK